MAVELKPVATVARDDWWHKTYMPTVKPEDRPFRVAANENYRFYTEDSTTIDIKPTREEAEEIALIAAIISADATDLLTLALEEPERAKEYIALIKKHNWE